jgi:hypothetical protein
VKRYPFAPLEAAVTVADGLRLDRTGHPVTSSRIVADALGRTIQQVYRWRKIGVTADQADELAMRAGFHPFEVWPEIADDQIAAVSRSCPVCSTPFVPNGRRRFCSDRCRWNRYARRVRSTPEGAAHNRAVRLRYYRENTAYESAAGRRYYQANAERLRAAQRDRDRVRRAATRTERSTSVVTSIDVHRSASAFTGAVTRGSDDAVA